MDSSSQHIPCIHPEPCDACLAFRTIDDEVDAMELALRQLKDRRQAAITNMNHSHDIVTRIPTEITAHIFYLYAHDEPTGILRRVFHLALVSKSWRDIALSSPELWTTFTLLRKAPTLAYPPAELLEMWLQRSGGRIVDVTLTLGRGKTGETGYCDDMLRDVLGPLDRHRDRIAPFSKLTIVDRSMFPMDFPPDLLSKFAVNLGRLLIPRPGGHIWRHIKRLAITSHISVSSAWNVLRACPLLEDCDLYLSDIRERFGPAQQTPASTTWDIHHAHLSGLSVNLGHNASFLGPLILPRLVTLSVKMRQVVQDVSPLQDTDMRHLEAMITRSNADLRAFFFEMTSRSWNDSQTQSLLNLVHHQPRLLILSLYFWQPSQGGATFHVDAQLDPHVARLVECFLDAPGPPFLPNLECFMYCNECAPSWVPIASFYAYHAKKTRARPLISTSFRHGGHRLIDEQSLAIFLTLPCANLKFRVNVQDLAESIVHYGLPNPGRDVLMYYDGLEEALKRVHRRA